MGNEEASESDEDCAFAFMVSETEEDICHTVICDEPVIEICVDGISTKALIDSGSVSNLMGMSKYEELKTQDLNVKLENCQKRLYAYGGKELNVVGQIQVELSVGTKKINSQFVVTTSGRCLLGHITSRDLPRIGLGASSESAECKYPKVFSGIGKLKEYRPVAQKPRRVPFALGEKVTAKVEDLIAKDIVERVDGPTSWVIPVVVAPKSEGDIRLCVDMRKANLAIIRERIPIPTVDQVVENLNDSAVFSKLDLPLGFHQIELDEESRDITTFSTHEGLFRYKRLSFKVNSAPEKYQQIIRQVVSDIEGVLNIADDLVVHGKSVEEHDQSLHKVLQRLEEKNLTLNSMKCEFRMDKVVFMGLLLSKYGIGPSEERVRAVLEAAQPTTPTEVQSFLGMVGFSARFIPNFATLAEPLRAISRQGVPFVWGKEQDASFKELKLQLASAPVLAYFDKDAHTRVIADEIEKVLADDEELQVVRGCLASGNWEGAPKSYVCVRNELTFIGHVILRGTRIVIPEKLRQRVLRLAHEGHQGIVKMKERLRSKVWWPGVDREAERKCRQCYGCQLVTKETIIPPVKTTRLPERPCQDLALDLLGPLPTGEHLLVLVDYFSRWVEVDIIHSTTSEVIIKCLDKQFCRYGVTRTLRTDNGANLVSAEMNGYLTEIGIKRRLTTPLWPRENGEVERQNRSLLKAMRAALAEKKDWRSELNKYRLVPPHTR